jgi:ElaB/YqjD/DUF883 family membrane-anchored ribosome-binding protein
MNNEVGTEQIVKDLKVLAHDAEDLVKATAGEVGEKAREARVRLSAAIQSAKESCKNWEEKALEGTKVADKAIREHPYPSIGFALAMGIVIGILVSRR